MQLLPEVLTHQIAAGEIVERPASVLKELLENSLDASATSISVQGEAGGQRLICVRDNGVGMSPDDARLAFERHATSKISTLEDLTRIRTLGFRGEALPSIASVSRLRLRTCPNARSGSADPGTEVQIQGGQLVEVREISCAKGTEVLVEDLFYNVPARKKFLKSFSTDLGHLTRQLTHYCLAYPSVRFHFTHHGRLLLEAGVSDGLEDRVFQVLGESFLRNLVPVDYRKPNLRVNGYVSLPHDHRSSTASQFLFVNRRMVR
ncbi:MAG: DNA mismatch repair endonuclease MutL, partial [Candidatus Aminicenantes bacterium]|nr:DNA mismatch repair endonuclease MutL [Candidatus Aminicenantes bacterium]